MQRLELLNPERITVGDESKDFKEDLMRFGGELSVTLEQLKVASDVASAYEAQTGIDVGSAGVEAALEIGDFNYVYGNLSVKEHGQYRFGALWMDGEKIKWQVEKVKKVASNNRPTNFKNVGYKLAAVGGGAAVFGLAADSTGVGAAVGVPAQIGGALLGMAGLAFVAFSSSKCSDPGTLQVEDSISGEINGEVKEVTVPDVKPMDTTYQDDALFLDQLDVASEIEPEILPEVAEEVEVEAKDVPDILKNQLTFDPPLLLKYSADDSEDGCKVPQFSDLKLSTIYSTFPMTDIKDLFNETSGQILLNASGFIALEQVETEVEPDGNQSVVWKTANPNNETEEVILKLNKVADSPVYDYHLVLCQKQPLNKDGNYCDMCLKYKQPINNGN